MSRWMKLFDVVAKALACVLLVSLTHPLLGEDWPTYQHDNRRSGVTGEQLGFPLQRIWQTRPVAPKTAWSGPAKWDSYANIVNLKSMRNFDPVFYTTAAQGYAYYGSSSDDAVHCLELETGREAWVFFTNGPVRLPPTFHQGKLLFGSDDGCVYSIDARSGQQHWKVHTSESRRKVPNNGKLISMWPCRTGVLVQGNIAYCAGSLLPWKSTYLFGLDVGTGTWQGSGQYKRTYEQMTAQGAMFASAEHLYLSQGRQAPLMFDLRTGDLLKTVGNSGFGGVYGLLADDSTFVHGHGQNHGPEGAMRFFSGKTQDQLLSYPLATSIVVIGNRIYVHADRVLRAIVRDEYLQLQAEKTQAQADLKADKKKLKQLEPNPSQQDQAAELEQRIHATTEEIKRIDRQIPSCFLWTVNSDCHLSLILTGTTLIAGGEDKVNAYDAQSGQEIWTTRVSGRAYGLTASQGCLIVSTDRGQIICFGQ